MTIGEIIKRYCFKSGITQNEFAAKCNLSPSYISQLIAGKNSKTKRPMRPMIETLQALADGMDMTIDDLFESMDNAPIPPRQRADIEFLSNDRLQRHRIPLIGSVAAGEPIYDEEIDLMIDGPTKASCAVRVKGDSMEPTYYNGDIVYIREQPNVSDGQIAVVFLDSDAALKRVYHLNAGLQLLSENPKYKPINATFDEYSSIRILGIPCGFTRMYDNGPIDITR